MNKKIITIILVLAFFGSVVYFTDEISSFFKGLLDKSIEGFKGTKIDALLQKVEKQISAPPPLTVDKAPQQIVLAKSKVISETNKQRLANSFLALAENPTLNAVAKAKAQDMFNKQYFEHVSPSGVGPGDLVQAYGYEYIVTGENLILGNFSSEKEMVDLWMNSPGHRANILNPRYSEIGVAVVQGTYKGQSVWIGVQEFGLPISSCPEPDQALNTQIENNKNQLDQLESAINAKNSEIDNTNPNSQHYNDLVGEYNSLVEQYNLLSQQTKTLVNQYNSQINAFNQCVAGEE